MTIINNVLDLALKTQVTKIDANDTGSSVLNGVNTSLNTLTTNVNTALAQATEKFKNTQVPYYCGYTIPAPSTLMTGESGTVYVGSDNGCWNCVSGNCCLWTVPAGASLAQFQIWGAGGNGNACDNGACCQFAQSGGNGEYTFVTMKVTPGQTYTLCAGGGEATTNNNCYVYCQCDGCNSFVCGSNSTCILSCGGSAGWGRMCGSGSRTTYPAGNHDYATSNASSYVCSGHQQCSGKHFGDPVFRCDGMCSGCITTANEIYQVAKIPSIVAGVRQCGNSICYMCQRVPVIDPDHKVCFITCGWSGYEYSGCCTDAYSIFCRPGMGGMGGVASCYSGPTYGSRGRSGLVIVKYK